MKDDAQPVQKPPRKVPLAMKCPFKEELDRMEKAGIISKYDSISGPAPEWLNSFVTVRKPNGSLCICLDPTDLNKHMVRPVCNSYTLDEIIDKLRGSLFFAVFDTTKGFFHVPMDEKSRLLTVMLTPYGIYIYNVLAMGLADATDIFELCIHQLIQDLQGVLNIADDILVFGRTREEFNSNVISFLDRCVKEDIHLNPDKVQINMDNIPFFGHVLTKDGIQPDESKVKLILDWPVPENQKELQQFMGSVNYLSKFLVFLSDLCAPLQPLLKKDSEFIWTDTHTIAFNCINNMFQMMLDYNFLIPANLCSLKSMHQNEALVLLCFSVILLSKTHYLQRFLTICVQSLMPVKLSETESNYSNIERELLGVVFAVTHFKHFTYGRPVTIISDHKPLVSLFKKSLTSSSPHLSRMLLQILDYDLSIVYQEGSKMHLSDAISRLSIHKPDKGSTLPGMDITVHMKLNHVLIFLLFL